MQPLGVFIKKEFNIINRIISQALRDTLRNPWLKKQKRIGSFFWKNLEVKPLNFGGVGATSVALNRELFCRKCGPYEASEGIYLGHGQKKGWATTRGLLFF
jgi:hypothetical protein